MTEPTKKKTLFDKAIDAVSNRDEKAAAEAAKLEAEKSKLAADKANREAAALRAKVAAQEANEKMKAQAAERAAQVKAFAEKAAAEKAAAEAAKNVKKYVLQEGETWSHVALKFYGHATPPYWQIIIDANKATVGEDYRRIWAGMEIIIPELPEELKDKK